MKYLISGRIYIILPFTLLLLLTMAGSVFAMTKAPGGTVTTMEELNTALGGVHTVSGHTITLTDDVTVQKLVRLEMFVNEVTIDANGKELIAERGVSDLFFANGTCLRLTGKGWYFTKEQDGRCICGLSSYDFVSKKQFPCRITIDSGYFDIGADKDKIKIQGYNADNRGKVIINGGDFTGGRAVVNDEAPVDIETNGGKIHEIMLTAPRKVINDMGDTAEYSYNTLKIQGETKVSYYVSTVSCCRTKVTMTAGNVNYIKAQNNSVVSVKGGRIMGKGIDILNGSRLSLTGGVLLHYPAQEYDSANDTEFILLKDSVLHKSSSSWKSVIKGVDIRQDGGHEWRKVYHGGRRFDAIRVLGKSNLEVSDVTCTSTDSNKIVRSAFYLEGSKKYQPVLTFKGKKGKTTKVKKFLYSVYCKGKYGKVKLAGRTLLTAKKKKYTSSKKLPRKIKGDLTVKYK